MPSPYGLELVESCMTCRFRNKRFFCSLPPRSLLLFETCKVSNVLPKGSVLFAAGKKANGIQIVCSGTVKLLAESTKPHKQLIVKFAVPGDVLGLHSCVANIPYEFTAETFEVCHIVSVKSESLRMLMARDGNVRWKAARSLAGGYDSACSMIRSLHRKPSARERVAGLILQLVEARGVGPTVDVPFTQKELAGAIGVSRSTIRRIMLDLRNSRIAALKRSTVSILDQAALQQLAGSQHPRR